ncbi:uncharacterized protein LTR77_005740 [Saxophila tyrrhenica]|uniref:Major facilitator superfamily (MFS) profile domain-containing protein n=1 Tax=Saxophila tyrrhenica TaxID=1690608 RepID=A0AAV9PCE9_9PEZI|nr:hypothetical protein LTR77_005740 [Saxophila tyrrhenica]
MDTNHNASDEKAQIELREDGELTPSETNHIHVGAGTEAPMTWKTWLVIFILSSCFGLSFWPVPTTGAIQAKLVVLLGDETGVSSYWFVPAYTTGSALGFLIAGANSDLFGRRWFL